VKIFNSTQTFKNVFVLKFELILIIGSNNVLTEGARKVYRGRLRATVTPPLSPKGQDLASSSYQHTVVFNYAQIYVMGLSGE
jgi:hypothetical protein